MSGAEYDYEEQVEEYEESRKEQYGQGLSIDQWLARPSEMEILMLAYRIREASRK